jgi:hypothetical protein
VSASTRNAAFYEWRKVQVNELLVIVPGPKHRARSQVDIRKDIAFAAVAELPPRHRAEPDLKPVEL